MPLLLTFLLGAAPAEPPVLGTAHPLFVQAHAPDGSWVVACQARTDTDGNGAVRVGEGMHGDLYGDRLDPYLLTPARPEGEPIGAFVDADPTGRWVVVEREGALELRDMVSGAKSPLGEPVTADDSPTLAPRQAGFSPGGELFYLTGNAPAERVVLRRLDTGVERALDVGPGRVWRAQWAGRGHLHVAVIPADTDGDGKLGLPRLGTTLAGGPCRGEPMSYSTYGITGDAHERRTFRVADGARETRAVLARTDEGLLVRGAEGAVVWVPAAGAEREVAPAACSGPVLGLLPDARAVLLTCGSPPTATLVDERGARPMAIPLGDTPRDSPEVGRLIHVGGYQLADLERGTLVPRAYAGEVGEFGGHLLQVDQAGTLWWLDLGTGERRSLLTGLAHAYGVQHGKWAALMGRDARLIDVERGRWVGTFSRAPIVVREDGAGLIPADRALGPLRWEVATPAP